MDMDMEYQYGFSSSHIYIERADCGFVLSFIFAS